MRRWGAAGSFAVDLHRDAIWPPLAELGDRWAGVEQRRVACVHAGLYKLLCGHDAGGEPAVAHAR